MKSTMVAFIVSSAVIGLGLTGCSSGSGAVTGAPVSSAGSPSTGTASTSASVQPSSAATAPSAAQASAYDIPANVQVQYYKAICEGSPAKLGLGGTFDQSSNTCTDGLGKTSTVSQGLASLLSSTPDQMAQSIQMMLAQLNAPVGQCPTLHDFNTKTNVSVSNACVVASIQAFAAYMSQ